MTYFLQLFFIGGIFLTNNDIYKGIITINYWSILAILLLFFLFLSVSFYNILNSRTIKSHQFQNKDCKTQNNKEIWMLKIPTFINFLIGMTITIFFIVILAFILLRIYHYQKYLEPR